MKCRFYWTHFCITWRKLQIWIMWDPRLWKFIYFKDFHTKWGICFWFLQVCWWKPTGIKGGCSYCEDSAPMILDEDGVKSSISGKPGRWAHANLEGHWGCDAPPDPDPDPDLVPYKFGIELIAEGKATACDDPDCEGGLVIDGVCTWCGAEYPA